MYGNDTTKGRITYARSILWDWYVEFKSLKKKQKNKNKTRKTQGDFTSVESSVSQRDFEIFKKKRSPEKRRERESRDFEDVDV